VKNDLPLQALIAAGKEYSPDVPESLLRKAYEIQVKHQYEKDSEIALKEMQKLVESYIPASGKGAK